MQQHGLAAGWRSFQLLPPIANELSHVNLRALELPYLLPKGEKFFLGEPQHALAGSAAVITRTKDFGKLLQRKTELQSPLRQLYALDGRCGEHPITATGTLREWQDAEPLVVAQGIRADASQACQLSGAHQRGIHDISMNPRTGSSVKRFEGTAHFTANGSPRTVHCERFTANCSV